MESTASIHTERFVENLRRLMRSQGLTQMELAEKMGVTQGYISQVANGRYNPSLDTLAKFAAGLGCNVHDLISENSEK